MRHILQYSRNGIVRKMGCIIIHNQLSPICAIFCKLIKGCNYSNAVSSVINPLDAGATSQSSSFVWLSHSFMCRSSFGISNGEIAFPSASIHLTTVSDSREERLDIFFEVMEYSVTTASLFTFQRRIRSRQSNRDWQVLCSFMAI